MAAVKEWLDTFGRGDLAAAFAAEGYDTLEGCSMMDWDEDLAGLEGMKKGFKKVLLAQIEALKVKLTPQPPPGQPSAGAASPASRGGKVAASAATAPQINADGSSIQTLEDGTVVQKNANGVVIELRKGECARTRTRVVKLHRMRVCNVLHAWHWYNPPRPYSILSRPI